MATISGEIHQFKNKAGTKNWWPRTVTEAIYGLDSTIADVKTWVGNNFVKYSHGIYNPASAVDLDDQHVAENTIQQISWNFSTYSNVSNRPYSSASAASVLVLPNSWGGLQFYTDYNSNTYYIRNRYSTTGWKPWVQLYHTGNFNPANYLTTSDASSTYAKLGTWNNLIHSGDEFTFASAGYSGRINFNFRTASGSTDGNISSYNFRNGAGGFAGVTASNFVVYGGTSSQFLKADGSVDSNTYLTTSAAASTYLPLSGGQMTGPLTWKNDAALPENTSVVYFLTIDAFGSGGTTKWASVSTVKTSLGLANYLPLTGGTLEKNSVNILNINSTSDKVQNWIYFKVSGTNKASLGYYSGLAFIANEKTYARIGVNDAGTPQYWSNAEASTAQTIYHSGNLDKSQIIDIMGGTFPEAYLGWGGRDLPAGSHSPVDAALCDRLGANRFAFANPAGIDIFYSRDSGSTWTDLGAEDSKKLTLTSGGDAGLPVGNANASSPATTAYRLKIVMYANNCGIYTQLNKFIIGITSFGSSGCWCTLRGQTKANYDAGNDTWTTFAEKASLTGWPGKNIINTTKFTYGSDNSHFLRLEFTFGFDSGTPTSTHFGLLIQNISAYGGLGYTEPSNMAYTGHLYAWDYSQTAYFPSGIVPSTSGNFPGNSTSRWGLYATSGNFSGSWANGHAGVTINNNTTSAIPWLLNALAPNMSTGTYTAIVHGKANSVYNAASLSFYNIGTGSANNYAGIGLYGHDNLLIVRGDGNVGIGTTAPAFKLDVAGVIRAKASSGQWSYLSLHNSSMNWDLATTNSTAGMLGKANTFEIREYGQGRGVAVRYGSSSYGRLVVVSETGESSIGYWSTAKNPDAGYPIWTVGYTDDENRTFGWYSRVSSTNLGWKMLLGTDGHLSVGGASYSSTYALNVNGASYVHGSITSTGSVSVAMSVSSVSWVTDSCQFIANATETNYRLGMAATTNGYGVIQAANKGTGAIPLLLNPSGGNVAIGITSPSTTYKLQVGGTQYLTGFLKIAPSTGGNWNEGIRLYPTLNWTTIVLGGNDLTADTGTSANSWSIHNNNGIFCIAKNGSSPNLSKQGLFNSSNKWSFTGGNVGIGILAPAYTLDVVGTIHSTVGIFSDGYVSALGTASSSDAKLKDDITTISYDRAKAVLSALNPREWTWNALTSKEGDRGAGMVAQEVESILPDTVKEIGGNLTLEYNTLFAYGLAMTKYMLPMVETHEEKIARLEKEVEELKRQLTN